MAVQAGDAEQPGQVDRAVDPVHLTLAEAELLEQEVRKVLRTGVGHLETHGVAVTPRDQLATQRAGQVLDVLGVHREVGVTGEAELVAALDPHAMEQVVGVGMDHRGEEDEIVTWTTDRLRHANHPRQQPWRRDDRQTGIATERIDALQLDDEVQALVHQQRERVGRIEPDGRDDRCDLVAEIAAHPGLELGRPMPAADEADLMFGKRRQQHVVEDRVLAVDLFMHQLGNARQRLMRLQTIGAGLLAGEGDALLQPGHANLEELVEVAGEDQQELQPFQQRIGLVQRLLQHADIELQLGKLAVDVQRAVIQIGHRCDRRLLDDFRRRGRHRYRFRLDHLQRLADDGVLQILFAESLVDHRFASKRAHWPRFNCCAACLAK